ncbi:putative esterase [Cryptosporidium canis]|uniref:Esterase n=1 Tax=Cryptosporidium canis TaxID=195482 RepID=A0A9D5HXJ2_9CRYT|nr:putative esterase [Cryptosporidium canis]
MNELESWNRRWRILWCWTHLYVHYKRAQVYARILPEDLGYLYRNDNHSQFAELMWRNISELRIWWIKVGQFLSTMGDLFPKEYVSYLIRLQDMIPWTDWAAMRDVLEGELGQDLSKSLKEIQEKPIMVTPVAQIHKAILKSGETVLIKIQCPNSRELANQDMRNLGRLVSAFDMVEDEAIIGDWQPFACKDSDFRDEFGNQERAYDICKDSGISIIIPKVYREYSAGQVLTMEYIDGFRITNQVMLSQLKVNKKDLLETLCDSFAYQIHIKGFFHGDPHPGNVLVVYDKSEKRYIPALIDWGVVGVFDKKTQIAFSKMIYSVSTVNLAGLQESFEEMGFTNGVHSSQAVNSEVYMNALRSALQGTELNKIEKFSIRESGYAAYKTITELSRANNQPKKARTSEEWPRDVIFFLRITSLIHGICRELNERVPLLKILSRRAQQFLLEESTKACLNPALASLSRGYTSKFERRLSDYIDRIMEESRILGLQASVIKCGKKLASISKGYKGEVNGHHVDEDTLFNGFFINLGVLVISILLCVERGYISLDDPICHYWDGFIRYGKRNVTLRHILNHRSGVISLFPEDLGLSEFLDYERMVQVMEDSAPQIPVDSSTRYNPYFQGWVLFELISLVTNQSAIDFMEENIIRPFGLQDGISLYVSERNLYKEVSSEQEDPSNEMSQENGVLFPIFSSSVFSLDNFSGMMGLSKLKSRFEEGGGQLMSELKEIIKHKLTPERMKKEERSTSTSTSRHELKKVETEIDAQIFERYALVRRNTGGYFILLSNIFNMFRSDTLFKKSKDVRDEFNIQENKTGHGMNKYSMYISRENSTQKLSTLEYFYLKPHVFDPVIYNSKSMINKWIPAVNGRYTSLSLAKLYNHLCMGEIISEGLLKQVMSKESVISDNSIDGLILTSGGFRKWSFGLQVLECSLINHHQRSGYTGSPGNSTFKGIGYSDAGGNLSFCFPDLDLSIAILTNDYAKGSYISKLILEHILESFGLYLNSYVPLFLS